MSKYLEVVQQLVSAAVDQGMSERCPKGACPEGSQVYAVADGGNGLREALEASFANLTFILDWPHLKQHFYEGAEAIGLTGSERHKWVSDNYDYFRDMGLPIGSGEVESAITLHSPKVPEDTRSNLAS